MTPVQQATASVPAADLAGNGHGPAEQRFLLHAIDWPTYEGFLRLLGDRAIRLTYDRGNLELMAPSYTHEWWKRRFGLAVEILAEESNLDVQGAGSTTLRREDLERGLESDECYYIGNEPRIRGKKGIDLRQDPPPDLAIEIDITSSSVNRMAIYAALEVPELWRFDGASLHVYRLAEGGQYQPRDHSFNFPSLPVAELLPFLHRTQGLSETGMAREFRAWVRQRLAATPGGPSAPPSGGPTPEST
jgi:Uma2 family endonuclease